MNCTLSNVKQDVLVNPAVIKRFAFYRGESVKCNHAGCLWQKHMHILYKVQAAMERSRMRLSASYNQQESELAIRKHAIKNAEILVDECKYDTSKIDKPISTSSKPSRKTGKNSEAKTPPKRASTTPPSHSTTSSISAMISGL